MSGRIRFVALAGMLAIAATSCGGSGSGGETTGDVVVTMKDFSLAAAPGTFSAGDITFGIRNDGPSAHEFVILRTDDAPDALPVENGLIPEDQVDVVDEAEDIAPGTNTSLRVSLEPGSYVLVCNLPAHYEAGMRAAFIVA
ncbi:MAG: plastocyanin/azurin family copper-binding protein [Actinomycetota bacterium]